MKTLIVEDQAAPLEALEYAMEKTGLTDYDVARWYTQAEEFVRQRQYDLVLLDHRMPYNQPECTEDEDFQRFSHSLGNIGYGLIPLIRERNPRAIIVGTSSLSNYELKRFPVPSHSMSKMFSEATEDLQRILNETAL